MRFGTCVGIVAVLGFLVAAGCQNRGAGSGRAARNFPVVEIVTSAGTIKAELWPDKAPRTVENFLTYVNEGFYDNTIFHRCIRGFMIQGGGLTPDWHEKPTHGQIVNEADNGLKNIRGTLAMARLPKPHTATSQFFINTVDNAALNHYDSTDAGYGYCVFGQVISGMDVVDAIEEAPTTGNEQKGRPVRPVVIKSIRQVSGPKPTAKAE